MKQAHFADQQRLIDWAAARNPGGQGYPDVKAIGLTSAGQILAVTLFYNFTPTQCFVSVAAERGRHWLTRDYLRQAAAYPFIQCRLHRITCTIPESNDTARRFAEHLGCQVEGRWREAALDGSDEVLYGLLRRECRWLPKTLGFGTLSLASQTKMR